MTIEEKLASITDPAVFDAAREQEGNPWIALPKEPEKYVKVQLLLKNPIFGCHTGVCYFIPGHYTEPNCYVNGVLHTEPFWIQSKFLHFDKSNIIAWRFISICL